MPRELLPTSLLKAVTPHALRMYATASGWGRVEGINGGIAVYQNPAAPLRQLIIPLDESFDDYAERVHDAVQRLAEFAQRSPLEVLNDLTIPPADVFRLRVQSRAAELGTLPLAEGLDLLQGGHDLLQAAACSAHQPQAYYRRPAFGPVHEFLRSCLIGQTERGSYVVAIIAPVTPELAPTLCDGVEDETLFQNEPYERRVTLLLMQALLTLRGTLDRGRSEDLLHAVEQGVSANLCEALAAMSPSDTQAHLQMTMRWSRNRPRVPRNVSSQVSFAQGEFALIREAGRRLRAVVQPRRERLEGPIISLQAEPAQLFEELQGSVTIRTLVEGHAARVRFRLRQAEYQQACDAHRDRRRIAVTGVLHPDAQARLFELTSPQDFRVLPAEQAEPDGERTAHA
jgi:hypothetical protein